MYDEADPQVNFFDELRRTKFWNELINSFLEFAPPCKGGKGLDVGTGPGTVAFKLSRKIPFVIGIDKNQEMVERAKNNAESLNLSLVQFQKADAIDLPFSSGEFDYVCASSVVYLLDDPFRGIREMVKVTKSGGRIAMLNPSDQMTESKMKSFIANNDLDNFTKTALNGWLAAAIANNRFSQAQMMIMLNKLGCENIDFQEELRGMVLFVKAKKPA